MKKIKANINQKDRIICITNTGNHAFYYQPVGSEEYVFLFRTDEFSGSVWLYFRDKGRRMNDRGFYLTVRELYEFDRYYNVKLTNVITRIPDEVSSALRKRLAKKNEEKKRATVIRRMARDRYYNDYKFVA